MTILGIETSCDETSVSVVRGGLVLANVVASQVNLHAEYGGVVPELATREHLRNFLPIARKAIEVSGIALSEVDAVAATRGPGLPSALMVGYRAAAGLALGLGRPLIPIHHHEAHLYSPWIESEPPKASFELFEPNVSLIVSGGHTLLVHVPALLQHRVLGGTVDDAAGECFDKVAKLIGLMYPGGPELDRLAQSGNPSAHAFPRPMLNDSGDDFSFSGLKTAVRYCLRDNPEILEDAQRVRNLCASVQAAIVDVLVSKTVRAACRLGVPYVTMSGGVSCNSGLRQQMSQRCAALGLKLRIAQPRFCTDNAGMIAVLAGLKFCCEQTEPGELMEIDPGWELGPMA